MKHDSLLPPTKGSSVQFIFLEAVFKQPLIEALLSPHPLASSAAKPRVTTNEFGCERTKQLKLSTCTVRESEI